MARARRRAAAAALAMRPVLVVAALCAALAGAQPARAALPSEAELEEYLNGQGLACQRFPNDDGGEHVRCDSPELNDYGMAIRGAQYQLRPDGELGTFGVETATDGLDPPDGDALGFLVGAAGLSCDDDPVSIEAWIVANGTALPGTEGGSSEDATFAGTSCSLFLHSVASGLTESPDVNQTFISVLEPIFLPSEQPQPPPATPAPVSEPPASDSPAPAGPPASVPFADAIPSVTEVSTDPIVLVQSAALALAVVLLMPFPGQLFNSTLETHEDEVRRWFRLHRWNGLGRGIGGFWQSWPGAAAFTGVAAVLYAFLDPGFGLDAGSIATLIGMGVGIVLVTVAFAAPVMLLERRHGVRPQPKVVPLSLIVAVLCVLVSRITGFQPGYLYGLLIGFVFARELSRIEEARAAALSAVAMLGLAMASWLALGALPEGGEFALAVSRTALAAVMVAGLEGVVFGMLPLRFLPGEPLYERNRLAWALLLGVGAFAFFHILINPASGYLSDGSRTPLLTTLALLIGFAAVSIAFWAWFRFRPSPAGQPGEAD